MVELLSPVGNREMLYQAVHNGADAVYLSGKSFGARKFADNFTNEELVEVICYCHIYGVKVYVTVNTLIYEEEKEIFLEYVKLLYESYVDAVIMQDVGMIAVVREMYPNLEVHASTQCHNHNALVVKFWKDLGVSRVVMAREMSLEEINNIDCDIEKEVFVYGALCVCYSGCCLFSSLNGGRSGNRGECVGSCRLPYKLVLDGKAVDLSDDYLLSTREVNTLVQLGKLLESGIDSFKIEGRMKSASYVGLVTRLYRTYIDKYYRGEDITVLDEEMVELKKLFNRKFTSGYLFEDSKIMNLETPNHQGIEIGQVLEVNKKKIKILLNSELAQNDGIRFKNSNLGMMVNFLYDSSGKLVREVKNGICVLENKIGLIKKDRVLKTIDYKLEERLKQYSLKKIEVDFQVIAHKNEELVIGLTDFENEVWVRSLVVEEARQSATDRNKVCYQLSKLGETAYKVRNISIEMDDDVFIPVAVLNDCRRQLVRELDKKRSCCEKEIIIREEPKVVRGCFGDKKGKISVLVRTEEQLVVCLKYDIPYIYVDNYELYCLYKDKENVYYRSSRVGSDYKEASRVLVTELGGVNYYQGKEMIGDYFLNVVNTKSVDFLLAKGCKRVTLSCELSMDQIMNMDLSGLETEVIVYGRLELMVMKYCPLKECLKYCGNCKKGHTYALEDRFGNRYPMVSSDCIMHILHAKVIDKLAYVSKYLAGGVSCFRIELFDEDRVEVEKIIKTLLLLL